STGLTTSTVAPEDEVPLGCRNSVVTRPFLGGKELLTIAESRDCSGSGFLKEMFPEAHSLLSIALVTADEPIQLQHIVGAKIRGHWNVAAHEGSSCPNSSFHGR